MFRVDVCVTDASATTASGREHLVVRCGGDFDTAGLTAFAAAVAAALSVHHEPVGVVLDLAEVAFIDAAGIGALIRARHEVARCGGDVVVRNPSPPVVRLLTLTGTGDRFSIEDRPDPPQVVAAA